MSRLSIDLSAEQHRSLKAMAAVEGKTIRDYAMERLFPEGEADPNWERLKAMLTERIERGLAGDVSPRSFDEIAATALEETRCR